MSTVLKEKGIYEAALKLLASGSLPCKTCNEPHNYRSIPNANTKTWAHPEDNHSYVMMDTREFAILVLQGKWEPDV